MTVKLNKEKDKIYKEKIAVKKLDKRMSKLIHKTKHYEESLFVIDEENEKL